MVLRLQEILQLELQLKVAGHSLSSQQKSMEKVDDAEDLDVFMFIYNYLEYSFNYSNMTGSLWFYSKVEVTNFQADIDDNDHSKSFKHKTELIGSTAEI